MRFGLEEGFCEIFIHQWWFVSTQKSRKSIYFGRRVFSSPLFDALINKELESLLHACLTMVMNSNWILCRCYGSEERRRYPLYLMKTTSYHETKCFLFVLCILFYRNTSYIYSHTHLRDLNLGLHINRSMFTLVLDVRLSYLFHCIQYITNLESPWLFYISQSFFSF